MLRRLPYIKQYFSGRKIVCWGCGELAEQIVRELEQLGIEISFFVDKRHDEIESFLGFEVLPKSALMCDLHYVIISTGNLPSGQIAIELEALGFREYNDYYKYHGLFIPIDFLYDGIPIGKYTYGYLAYANVMGLSRPTNCIASIGRFTSINNTSYMNKDHNMTYLTTSPWIGTVSKEFLPKTPSPGAQDTVAIGNDVWIGAKSYINASKVRSIGNGAVIGANAVVLEDVPPYAIVVGVPAKVKKYRFTEKQIEIFERVKWWDWNDEQLMENGECFCNPNLFFEKFG